MVAYGRWQVTPCLARKAQNEATGRGGPGAFWQLSERIFQIGLSTYGTARTDLSPRSSERQTSGPLCPSHCGIDLPAHSMGVCEFLIASCSARSGLEAPRRKGAQVQGRCGAKQHIGNERA